MRLIAQAKIKNKS